MTRLPLTVISGYLGAGKTTLINRLLAEDHGQKLLIMVNDFGAINIDAGLLLSADDDTIALTNGCVCCTMGADLYLALGDALDRMPRPDHLIIEASGVADPAKIANTAKAEPDMDYAGIVTVVDGPGFDALIGDTMIGAQVAAQIAGADLIYVTKQPGPTRDLNHNLATKTDAPVVFADAMVSLAPLLFAPTNNPKTPRAPASHPAYIGWSYAGDLRLDRPAITKLLAGRPAGVFRLKGTILGKDSQGWDVQVVGKSIAVTRSSESTATQLVAIGLKDRLARADIDQWWANRITEGDT